jgi:pyruvate dehydrogenase E1 component alpha subunit
MFIDSGSALGLYKAMVRIRLTEEQVATRYAQQEMRCPVHLCIGQEAIAAGVSAALRGTDKVFSNHRAHGHYLAKGGDMGRMIAEFYGRADGCCGGRGGSMHLIDQAAGFMGSTPIVGGTVPLAVGMAWSQQLQAESAVSLAFFGDGCFEEGVVHESMNFAALHSLPLLFVCENNEYSVYTPLSERQPDRPIHAIAAAHGWSVHFGDGNDALAVHDATRQAVLAARSGAGPQFLQFSAYRWREHCGPDFDDHLNYRAAAVILAGLAKCPIARASALLREAGLLDDAGDEAIKKEIEQEIEAAFTFALASPMPTETDASAQVYAD